MKTNLIGISVLSVILVFLVSVILLSPFRANPTRTAADMMSELRVEAMRRGVENCLRRGGIPVFSGWDGSLRECR